MQSINSFLCLETIEIRFFSDDTVTEILPSRDSICTSGSTVTLYQPYCTLNMMTNTSCPAVSRDIMEKGAEDLGCM